MEGLAMHTEYGETWRNDKGFVIFYPETYKARAHYQGYVNTTVSNRRVGAEAIGFQTETDAIKAVRDATE